MLSLKTATLVACATALVVGQAVTTGDDSSATAQIPAAAQSNPCPGGHFHQSTQKKYVSTVYRRKQISPQARQLIRLMQTCAKSDEARKKMYGVLYGVRQARKGRAIIQARIDAITPFPGPHGTRWAIPYPVVACEGGADGWSKFNDAGSGAAGPYQLLGWGAPMPANTPAKRLQHHRIARRLYLASGLGPWAASRGCWG